jgi:sugar phosphate isomerase/epimerase
MKSYLSRRTFLNNSLKGIAGTCIGISLLDTARASTIPRFFTNPGSLNSEELFFKISLAQWSLHRSFNDNRLKAEEFPAIAKEQFNIDAVEYVNSLYAKYATDSKFWTELKQRATDHGVRSLLMMVDDEGELGNPNEKQRKKAVENHYKWVDHAKRLGCHSIRVNGFGDGNKEEVGNALVDGMGALGEYAAKVDINVVIENHGLYSSDGKWVADVITKIGKDNCGTLPDFGNFCTARKWGSTQDGTCPEVYDRYLGVKEMLPFAKGVSAKSYRFDENGQETTIDYGKMLSIVKKSGFTGYIGIEYEGSELSEPDGIKATKNLLTKEGLRLS